MTEPTTPSSEYVIWSNEHHAWWGPDERGYVSRIDRAGRYPRQQALKICSRARGGREFNDNPSEIPLLLGDAAAFWPDDKPEWARKRAEYAAAE